MLALYDLNREFKVSAHADASSYRLRGTLLQLHREHWRPVAFTSAKSSHGRVKILERSIISSHVWTCEKFYHWEAFHRLAPCFFNQALTALIVWFQQVTLGRCFSIACVFIIITAMIILTYLMPISSSVTKGTFFFPFTKLGTAVANVSCTLWNFRLCI